MPRLLSMSSHQFLHHCASGSAKTWNGNTWTMRIPKHCDINLLNLYKFVGCNIKRCFVRVCWCFVCNPYTCEKKHDMDVSQKWCQIQPADFFWASHPPVPGRAEKLRNSAFFGFFFRFSLGDWRVTTGKSSLLFNERLLVVHCHSEKKSVWLPKKWWHEAKPTSWRKKATQRWHFSWRREISIATLYINADLYKFRTHARSNLAGCRKF